jgi:quinoprotein glucose dehydrogenase
VRGTASAPKEPGGAATSTVLAGAAPQLNVQGLPLVKPPYDRITAFDMNRGEIVWQKAHSSTPDNIRNHPVLKGLDVSRLGQTGRPFIGTVVTRTLLIAGDFGFHTNASGQRGALLRAYDKATGAEVGAIQMPAGQTGSPITYMHQGKQYIVLAVSGANYSGELLAFRLGQ